MRNIFLLVFVVVFLSTSTSMADLPFDPDQYKNKEGKKLLLQKKPAPIGYDVSIILNHLVEGKKMQNEMAKERGAKGELEFIKLQNRTYQFTRKLDLLYTLNEPVNTKFLEELINDCNALNSEAKQYSNAGNLYGFYRNILNYLQCALTNYKNVIEWRKTVESEKHYGSITLLTGAIYASERMNEGLHSILVKRLNPDPEDKRVNPLKGLSLEDFQEKNTNYVP